jgi:DNA-binding phage protein
MAEEKPPVVLSAEEEAEIRRYLGAPDAEEKAGIYHFFNRVLDAPDTSKVSNLENHELEAVRRFQSVNNFAKKVGLARVGEFFRVEGEVILATADSKNGFLIQQAISSKRELKTKRVSSQKKGWFAKKEAGEE